jgi:dihydroorotate dehydrogenase electron transfer subunit
MLKNKIFTDQAHIISIQERPNSYLDIVIRNENIALNAEAGQFVMLSNWSCNDPLLLRPFNIVDTDKKQKNFRLIVKVVGKGTRLMQQLRIGDTVTLIGPLGKAITDYSFSSMVLLIRGCGAAAVLSFAKQAFKKGITVHTILSAANKEKLILAHELKSISKTFHTATDDGSSGYKGLASELLKEFIQNNNVDRIYSCGGGPFYHPLLETLHVKHHLPVYLFVENYMACGTGHCHGCAIKKKNRDDYYLVCKDGPLFSLDEVENPCLIYQ